MGGLALPAVAQGQPGRGVSKTERRDEPAGENVSILEHFCSNSPVGGHAAAALSSGGLTRSVSAAGNHRKKSLPADRYPQPCGWSRVAHFGRSRGSAGALGRVAMAAEPLVAARIAPPNDAPREGGFRESRRTFALGRSRFGVGKEWLDASTLTSAPTAAPLEGGWGLAAGRVRSAMVSGWSATAGSQRGRWAGIIAGTDISACT